MLRTWILPLEPTVMGVYGDTGGGKSAQGGHLAEWLVRETGGRLKDGKLVGGCKVRVYWGDSGDLPKSLISLREWGALEFIDMRGSKLPAWEALMASEGKVPQLDAKGVRTGKWVESPTTPDIGLFIFDSGTQMCSDMMRFAAQMKATGKATGGEDTFVMPGGDAALGDADIIGTNSRTHYNLVQLRLTLICQKWGKLAKDNGSIVYTTWMIDRGDDKEMTSRKVLGPKSAGGAMTSVLPSLMGFTYRLSFDPSRQTGKEYVLHTRTHRVPESGNAEAVCNARLALPDPSVAAQYEELATKVPKEFVPADVVAAIKVNQEICRKVEALRAARFQ